MTKHTPEWKVFTDGDDNLCIVIKDGYSIDTWIAKIFDNDLKVARLIAAAPEMLEVIVDIFQAFGSSGHTLILEINGKHMNRIRSAIRKARGE